MLRAENTRLWLLATLTQPTPAREIFNQAKLEGIPVKGLKRAKKRLKVRSVKTGGKQHGWGAQWIWQVPVSK